MSQTLEHPEELLPWYVNGTLRGDELRQVEQHLRSCIACRRQVKELEELRLEVQATELGEADPEGGGLDRLLEAVGDRPTRRGGLGLWLPLAAAALLAVVVGDAAFRSPAPSLQVAERAGESRPPLHSSISEDQAQPRSSFELRWQMDPEWQRASYSIRVTTVDLRLVAEADELEEPRFRIPPEALADLPASTRLLWQVDVLRADGERHSSATFVARLE